MANNRELSQFASFVEVGISSIGFTTSVGIGKTNPQFNLDVAGDINFTGTFYQGGTQFIASRWSATGSDIYRLSKVGINTSIVPSALTVNGDVSVSGVVTATSINVSGISTLGITSTTNLTSQSLVVSGISTLGITSATNLTSQSLVVSGISTLGITSTTNLTSQSLVVSGISTLGITSATNLTSQSLVVSGISTLGITSTTNLTSQSLVVSGISTLGITSATNLTSQSLVVSGISTFTNGPILVGTATSTGTASQPLQVTGGAYVSGSFGIGTTNPSQTGSNSKVHISGGPLKLDSNTELTWDGIFPTYIKGVSGSGGRIEFNAGNGEILVYTSNSVGANISDLSPNVTQKIDLGRYSLQYRNTWIGGNLFVGTATSTGTASQPLQVTGGAYVSGNIGIGTTNPGTKLDLQSSSNDVLSIKGGTNATFMVFDNNSIDDYKIGGVNVVAPFVVYNNTDARYEMVFDGTGNVLIGSQTATGTASQLLQVDGGAYVSGNLGIGTTNPTAKLSIGSVSGFQDTITTVATTAVTTIDSFATATFRSTRAQVQITQSTNYQASDVLIIHDGTTASIVEYGSIATNDYLGTFSASVSGGNCLLRINMSSATSATVKVLSQRITV